MKRKIAVIYIICFVSAFLCPFRAFAYDSQYVNEFEKWTANESAEWLELEGDSATGYMQYFYGDNCAYFHFFVQSSDFAENDDSLYITADIENLNRAYSLRFSADSDDSGLPCKIYKNFGTAPAGLPIFCLRLNLMIRPIKIIKTLSLYPCVRAAIALRQLII